MPRPVQYARLAQAIESFRSHAGRDVPEGLTKAVEALEVELGRADPKGQASPGTREAQKVSGNKGTDGAGEHYSLPRGPDKPSPGQKEALSVAMNRAASELVEKAKSSEASAYRDMNDTTREVHADLAEASFRSLPAD